MKPFRLFGSIVICTHPSGSFKIGRETTKEDLNFTA
jgi:hypothetical protein